MSENTVNAALRRMGYTKDEMTGHGFRSLASTLLNEQGWHRDAIEHQLAHGERDAVRAAYNYAEHLPERRKMMQAWADYLDSLKTGAEVVPLHGKLAWFWKALDYNGLIWITNRHDFSLQAQRPGAILQGGRLPRYPRPACGPD